jgi:hypothetical protein
MHLPWCDNLRIDVIIDCDIVIMKPKERVNSRGGAYELGVLGRGSIKNANTLWHSWCVGCNRTTG